MSKIKFLVNNNFQIQCEPSEAILYQKYIDSLREKITDEMSVFCEKIPEKNIDYLFIINVTLNSMATDFTKTLISEGIITVDNRFKDLSEYLKEESFSFLPTKEEKNNVH